MKLFIFLPLLTTFAICNGQQLKTKSKTTANNAISKGASITSLKVGEIFSFPIVNMPDKQKSAKINSYIINSVLGDEYNNSNLKVKLEAQKKDVEKNYRGLSSLNYTTIFNTPSTLSISISSCWIGNNENCEEVQYNFDLSTGYSFGFDQIIIPSKKYEIKQMIITELGKRLKEAKAEMKKESAWNPDYETAIRDELSQAQLQFEPSAFKLSDKGISFVYNSMPFAMVDRAFFPSPDYFYSWERLKPYLLTSSPIRTLVK